MLTNITSVTVREHIRTHVAAIHGRQQRLSAEERRAQIIEAAVQAFSRAGLHGTSTEEVARLAGVSQPYIFRLFGSKQELFVAALGRAFDRIRGSFTEAARHPVSGLPADQDPVLAAMGRAYGDLMADQTILRLQLHAFAACDDPAIRDFTRAQFSGLVAHVSQLSGVPAEALRSFFAEGMLLNAAAAMDLTEADVAWQRICEEGAY